MRYKGGNSTGSRTAKDCVTGIGEGVCVDVCCLFSMCESRCANVRRHGVLWFSQRYYVHMNVFLVCSVPEWNICLAPLVLPCSLTSNCSHSQSPKKRASYVSHHLFFSPLPSHSSLSFAPLLFPLLFPPPSLRPSLSVSHLPSDAAVT